MIPRNPKINFDGAPAQWAPNLTFAHSLNSASCQLPYLEPYLNKVIQRAMNHIDDPALRQDMTLFMAQEGNHYRQHKMFNKALHARYPGLAAFEADIARDFDGFFTGGSLAFNASYCEGFESLGLIQAQFYFEQTADLLTGAHPAVANLWKWHFAEEFEHRTVCFDVQKALGFGYFWRIYGLFFAAIHLGNFSKRVTEYMLGVDRATMTADERTRSMRAAKRYNLRLNGYVWPRILKVLSPFYTPRAKRPMRGAAEFLAAITVTA